MTAQDVNALLRDPEFVARMDATIARYPKPETALLQCLHLCQEELRHVPLEFQAHVADRLGFSPAHVRGVVTFYEMYTEKPLGKYLLQVCRTLPCMLAGSEALLEHVQRKLRLKVGDTTQDGRFTLITVECLACCDGGPALMVNETLHRRVTTDEADRILAELD